MGLTSSSFPVEEVFWAARKALEHMAARRPLLVVFDDIHWAEPTFLDLVESVTELASASLFLVCAARLDLLEERPGWGERSVGAITLMLEPLTEESSEMLAAQL